MSCWGSSSVNATMSNESLGIYRALERFNEIYKDAHSYLSIFICVLGVFLNAANVVVLTRPAMAANPINALLTIIALADAAVMLSYVPFAVWSSRDLSYCAIHWQTYGWAYFVLFNSCLTVVCHAVSIWLTVAMALIRAITVRKKGFSSLWTNKNSYVLSFITFLAIMILYIPGLVSYEVVTRDFDADYCRTFQNRYTDFPVNHSIYITSVSELGYANQCLLLKSAFWINGVIFKMIPCVLLTVFIGVLLHILTEVKQRKTRLRLGSTAHETGGHTTNGVGGRRGSDQSRTDRTTLMLVVLLAVFLVAELPQGLLLISTGLASSEFRTRVFMSLGTLTDMLSLLNSAVNFVIMVTMSQKFRQVFCETILPRSLHYGYFCDTTDASTMYATNGNLVTMRNRTSLVPFRRSTNPNTNTAEITAAAYSTLQNGPPTARESLCVPVATKKTGRSDSSCSSVLVRTPSDKKLML